MASKTRSRPVRRTRKKGSRRPKRAKTSFKTKALKVLDNQHQSTTKYWTTFSLTQFTLATKTLFYQNLNNIPRQDSGAPASLVRRERDVVHVSGVRVRMSFRNSLLTPMVVNVALVIPQRMNVVSTAALMYEFFRSTGVSDSSLVVDRNLNFDDYTAMSGIQYNTCPINTDRMSVIWHTRFKLGVIATNGGFSSGELKNYRTLARYVRVNKNITFGDNTGDSAQQRIILLVWTSGLFETNGNPVADAIEFQTNNSIVFRDID